MPETEQEAYRQKMINWNQGQIAFAKGRKALLIEKMKEFPSSEAVQKALIDAFTANCDRAITLATEALRERESMTLRELAKEMGYSL